MNRLILPLSMTTSLFLAKLFSVIYVTVAVGIFVNENRFRSLFNDMLNTPHFLYFEGVLALAAGFVIVQVHNLWVADWPVIITAIGWIAVLKGITLVIFPDKIVRMAQFWLQNMKLAGVLTLILGLVLGYFGFVA